MRWPWRVPSSRVSSARMLMYLREGAAEMRPAGGVSRVPGAGDAPLEVGDVLVVGLAADVDNLGQQLVPVCCALGLVHVAHQLLDDLHQALLGHLGRRGAGEGGPGTGTRSRGHPTRGHAPFRTGGRGHAAGWTRPCHPGTAGRGPCEPARTWGAFSGSWTWPATPGTSLRGRKTQTLVRHDRLGDRHRLQHGPPLSPDSLGALVDSGRGVEKQGTVPLPLSAVKVADTF